MDLKIIIYFSLEEDEKAKDVPGGVWQPESEKERRYSQDCSFENSTYHVGEFVYVEPSEPKLKPHIVCIERLWEDEAGNMLIMFLEHQKKSLSFRGIHIVYYGHMAHRSQNE